MYWRYIRIIGYILELDKDYRIYIGVTQRL